MPDIVVSSTGILDVLVLIGILVLIFVFILKLYNILTNVDLYDIALSVVVLAIGMFAYIFIEIGTLLSFTSDVESILLEYNMYFWFARLLIVFIWIFWFAEIFLFSVKQTTETLSRMPKRRNERMNRY